MGQASSGGSIGSARVNQAIASTLADQSLRDLKDEQAAIEKGIISLGQAGTTKQKFQQQLIDAPYTEQTRLAGLLSGAPTTQTQTSSGGGK
jgi:hypothetical protein